MSHLFCVAFFFSPFCCRVAFILFFSCLDLDYSIPLLVLLGVTREIAFCVCNLPRPGVNCAGTVYPVRTFNHCHFPFLLPHMNCKCHVLLFLYFRTWWNSFSLVDQNSRVLHSGLRVLALSEISFLLQNTRVFPASCLPVMRSLCFYLEKVFIWSVFLLDIGS